MIRRPPRSTRTAPSFPTRRSSDLRLTVSVLWSAAAPVPSRKPDWRAQFLGRRRWIPKISSRRSTAVCTKSDQLSGGTEIRFKFRSEEHTSELQSLMRISYAVFCLKKKNDTTPEFIYHITIHHDQYYILQTYSTTISYSAKL